MLAEALIADLPCARTDTAAAQAVYRASVSWDQEFETLASWFVLSPHRAVNRTGGERYALAFFCDAEIDWPIAAVPTCVGPDRPPR